MFAREEATEEYHRAHPGLRTSILGRTGLRVSGAGFGGYRISAGLEVHGMALRKALTSGINLVDTSANYADGASEELIGGTIGELGLQGAVRRSEIVVVSKGGYIQGNNYEMAIERKESGSGFPEVVEYAPQLWHCIAPEFLHDQITRSLERLKLTTIDVYLLHNPEYYLSWAAKNGVLRDDARAEYYRRIKNAFVHLEKEVEQGRIKWYGISSNSFPHATHEADFTSLAECIRIAEGISLVHHFGVIQFPANLCEPEFVTEPNQPNGKSLIELAREKNIGVLINRPLNGIINGSLIRLADFPVADLPFNDDHVVSEIDRLIAREQEFSKRLQELIAADDEADVLPEFIAVGRTMEENWNDFGSIEHFNDALAQYFAPRLGYAMQYLREHGTQADMNWYTNYIAESRALFQAVGAHYGRKAQERSNRIRAKIAEKLGRDVDGTLSAAAIRMLLGVEGVDCVLVGMRRDEYVDDVLTALRAETLGDEEVWKKVEPAALVE